MYYGVLKLTSKMPLEKVRYNYFPDHIIGEVLSKRWVDNAIPFFTLILVALGLLFTIDGFFSLYSITDYSRQFAELGLIVLAMTIVMIAGGIDLSVGSIFAVSNLVALYCIHVIDMNPFVAFVVTCSAGVICGSLNGFFIGYMKMRAFLTTLVSLIIYRSVVDLLLLEFALDITSVFPNSELWYQIGDGTLLEIPYVIMVTALIFFLGHLIISRMKPGWHLTAVGGARRSAFNAGINVKRTVFLSYVTSGLLCSIAGYMYAARLASTGADTGMGLELIALTAAVLGGNSLGGGRGSVPKALFGTLIVLFLSNGLMRFGIQGGTNSMIFGVILLFSLWIDVRWLKNRSKLLSKVYVSPVYVDLPTAAVTAADSGSPYAQNDKLREVELIGLGEVEGPEDVILDEYDNLYTGTRHGDIIKFHGPDHKTFEVFAHIGGHPLGMAFDKDKNLISCIPGMGVYSVSPDQKITKLTDQTNRSLTSVIDDDRLSLADDLDIAPDGRIFFSEASIRYGLEDWPVDCLESRGNGRIVVYDPKNKSTKTIIKNLSFANGVCLSNDGVSILYAETFGCRISQYWFDGPNKGTNRVIIDNLPGYPDNINRSSDGQYWLALVGMRGPALDLALTMPGFRKRMARRVANSEWLYPNINTGCVIKFSEDGVVSDSLWDLGGVNHPMVTSMREHKGYLYLGGISNNRIGKYKIPGADSKWEGYADYWGGGNV